MKFEARKKTFLFPSFTQKNFEFFFEPFQSSDNIMRYEERREKEQDENENRKELKQAEKISFFPSRVFSRIILR
jgi:hypothetical protein